MTGQLSPGSGGAVLVGDDDMADAQTGGGRRWVPLYWLHFEQACGTLDQLTHLAQGGSSASVVDRAFEYRLLFDLERDLWRLDRRKHVPGG